MRLSLLAAVAILSLLWCSVHADDAPSNLRKQQQPQPRGPSSRQTKRLLHKSDKKSEHSGPGLLQLKCILLEAFYLFAPGYEPVNGKDTTESWKCEVRDQGSVVKNITGLPKDFFVVNEDKITSGATIMTVVYPDEDSKHVATMDEQVLHVPEGATIGLSDIEDESSDEEEYRHRRTKVKANGKLSVLVIRVSDSLGNAPVRTAKQISRDIFGGGDDIHNLQSQYEACSGGKLKFVPAAGKSIVDGVAELKLPTSTVSQTASVVENWVTKVAPKVVENMKEFSLVLYILPNTVNFSGAAAYTYVGSSHSVFLDRFSPNLLVLMHEVGHNLGNRHSGEGNLAYGDGTCMMGAHVYDDDGPKMCFNGAKSWYFGWYDDRHVNIDPTKGSWSGSLVGIDDYLAGQIADNPKAAVIVRIQSKISKAPDLFIMYNRREGVNSQVHEMPNLVTVVEQEGENGQSWLLAGLAPPKGLRYKSWNSGQYDLVIEVCDRVSGTPDYAKVVVFLDDGGDNPSCPKQEPPPPDVPPDKPEEPDATSGKKVKTVEFSVLTKKDDYKEKKNGGVKVNTKTDFLFSPRWNLKAYRFQPTSSSNAIPPGSKIESAEMLVYSGATSRRAISGYAVGNQNGNAPGNRGGRKEISRASKTKAQVSIGSNLPAWREDTYEKLADVTSIVKEIVDLDDYRVGNPMEIFLVRDGGSKGTRKTLTADSGKGAKLRITFVVGTGRAEEDDTNVKQIELKITDPKDDFRETNTGTIGTKSKSHALFTARDYLQAYRFQNVAVPKGGTIVEARLEMVGMSKWTLGKDLKGIIQGEAVGNSLPYKFKASQLKNAKKTKSSVKVENLPTWKNNSYNKLGDVAPIIQEIVNRADYKAGNAIKLILTNNGSKTYRRVQTLDGGGPAKLVIRYKS